MSLICETIVSSDELSRDNNEEELDFDEEIPEEKDEGELDDDEDLEEGEVKDEEEDPVNRPKEAVNRQNSICRFYGRGQCTWGNNCRFVHPTGGQIKRAPPPPPPPVNVTPISAPLRRREQFFSENESAWERGLKQAKEMIVRASRRKEEELDFEDKRFNLNSGEEKAREYDEEYERRRRLAFESAPWNNEEPLRAKNAETYRDPWRRSKSPLKRRQDSGSKRSHSMSSISASGSDSSDFSGSEGSESFSSSGSNISGHSGTAQRKRFNPKTQEKKIPKKSGISSSNNWKQNADKSQENYDSWSESLSSSESISSYYSGSDSEEQTQDKRIQKRPQKPDLKRKEERNPDSQPLKKAKRLEQKINKEQTAQEAPKKSPIKMTFMKKKQSLKKEISSLAFNGRAEEPLLAEEEDQSLSDKDSSLHEASTPPPVSPRTNNRREELLQQLRAVEDAIARKRSKIN